MSRHREVELTVVVPAYNEGAGLAGALAEWSAELQRLGISHVLRVYDDGSSDDTPAVLRSAQISHLEVVRQANRGHGPTVLRGYREAASEWIFQVDGDDEIGPGAFASLWNRRRDYDLLLGARQGRRTSLARRVITRGAAGVVRATFGAALDDVNIPYRLMRTEAFAPLWGALTAGSFAPNVALSGMAVVAGLRVFQAPVSCRAPVRSQSSLRSVRLIRGVAQSLGQTAVAAWHARRRARRTPTSQDTL